VSGAAELAGADLESQFAMLESGSGVDDELAALKAQMSLPPGTPQITNTTGFLGNQEPNPSSRFWI